MPPPGCPPDPARSVLRRQRKPASKPLFRAFPPDWNHCGLESGGVQSAGGVPSIMGGDSRSLFPLVNRSAFSGMNSPSVAVGFLPSEVAGGIPPAIILREEEEQQEENSMGNTAARAAAAESAMR